MKPLLDPLLGSDPKRARWRCAQLDPPWPESGGGGRGAQEHYDLASPRKIRAAILDSGLWMPHVNAHAFCWYTDTYLPDALWLMSELGFRYVRTFQWIKCKGIAVPLDLDTGIAVEPAPQDESDLSMSLGQYGRGSHEGMLFCVRGAGLDPSVMTDRKDILSVFFAPVPREGGRRIHSRKPDAAYELIEARSRGPYCEFFARRGRPGWMAWGNEAPEAQAS